MRREQEKHSVNISNRYSCAFCTPRKPLIYIVYTYLSFLCSKKINYYYHFSDVLKMLVFDDKTESSYCGDFIWKKKKKTILNSVFIWILFVLFSDKMQMKERKKSFCIDTICVLGAFNFAPHSEWNAYIKYTMVNTLACETKPKSILHVYGLRFGSLSQFQETIQISVETPWDGECDGADHDSTNNNDNVTAAVFRAMREKQLLCVFFQQPHNDNNNR